MALGTNPYYEATFSLLTPEEAGEARKFLTPIWRGYRAAHLCLDGVEWVAGFWPVDREMLQPGETGQIVFVLISSDFPHETLWVGKPFPLCLAGRVLGHGTITAILDEMPKLTS